MERGFYHPSLGYWQTICDPDAETLAGYPEGTADVPLKPGAGYEWTGADWVHVPTDPAAALAAWRAAAVLSRLELARALQRIGILTHAEAMSFCRYEPLPAAITSLIDTLPEQYREDALFEMQGGRDFPRSHPMWDLLCDAEGWPDEADVDALFGWGVE